MLIHPEFEKAYKTSTDVDPYYMGKYKYLKGLGFFAKPKLTNFATTIDESTVKKNIIQTKQVVFEVTGSCNLKCSYCAQGELYDGFERTSRNINPRSAINLLNYIFDLKHKNKETQLTIAFYGGEPLLNMNFIKQIIGFVNQLSVEKEINISYIMTSNATLIHKYIHFLVANKFKLMISLDGNEENHSYRTFSKNKKNSFNKVIENLDMIQRDYPEYFDSNISFNAVLHNRNSLQDIYEFIYNRYHKIPKISELALDNIKLDKKDIFNKMFHGKRKSEVKYQKEDSKLLHVTHNELSLFRELINFLKYYSINFYISNLTCLWYNEERFFPTNTCLPFSKKIFLTNRDKLLPCERISHKYTMGEVHQKVIIDIPKITQQFNFYYEHFQKVCQYCHVHRFCGLCMLRINNLDEIDTEEFVCDGFHDQKAFQTKLCRIFSFLEKHPNDFFEILENVVITT
jgi:uncharacterized protein